jgi:hypothetical protein
MSQTHSEPQIEPHIARAVHEWISGRREHHARFFFSSTGDAARAVSPRVGARDVLLTPELADREAGRGLVIGYRGCFAQLGDELTVSGQTIELQDYVAAAFVDVLGPTVVRFVDSGGWRAFLDDAEIARESGILPPQLRDPRMQLADRAALLDPFGIGPADSFAIGDDGRVTFGAQGAELGSVDDAAAFEVEVPRLAAFAGVVPLAELTESLTQRMWLPRLLALAELRRALPAELSSAPASGFGRMLVDDGGADAVPQTLDPFLLSGGSAPVLADPVTRRQFRLSDETARVIEIVQTSSSAERAAQRIAAECGIAVSVAERLRMQAIEALSVHHGFSGSAA